MFDLDRGTKVVLGLTATVGLGYSISWLMRQQQLKRFEKIGTVKQLVVYPVKSCKGVYIKEAECTKFGLSVNGVGDRTWMLIRENNRFMSQRQNAKMALMSVTITDTGVVLNAPDMTPLILPNAPTGNPVVKQCISTMDSSVEGVDCGDKAADWVSRYLSMPGIRIVHYTKDLRRRHYATENTFWETSAKEEDLSVYPDWATYLLLTESSLEALNKELPSPVTIRTFRPNIILSGTKAYDEDNWTEVRIGDCNQLRCVSACPRCVLTTVDPDTGFRRDDGEPLKTLKRVRNFKDGAMFGMFLAPDTCGSIKVGDPVYALRKLA